MGLWNNGCLYSGRQTVGLSVKWILSSSCVWSWNLLQIYNKVLYPGRDILSDSDSLVVGTQWVIALLASQLHELCHSLWPNDSTNRMFWSCYLSLDDDLLWSPLGRCFLLSPDCRATPNYLKTDKTQSLANTVKQQGGETTREGVVLLLLSGWMSELTDFMTTIKHINHSKFDFIKPPFSFCYSSLGN